MASLAVILIALGGPGSIEEVGPFMSAFMKRPVPLPTLAAVQDRYRLIGDKSPLVDIVKAQAVALEKHLGTEYRTYCGFRFSTPSIEQACNCAVAGGARTIIAVSLSPFETSVTTGTYKEILDSLNLPVERFPFISSFFDNPYFLQTWQTSLAEALEGTDRDSTAVIFTSHSIPLRCIVSGDPYKDQIEQTAGTIAEKLGLKTWFTAWQSKSARATEAWIEPDVESVMSAIAGSTTRISTIVEVPLGFTCDHLETLYDIDIIHKAFAEKLGFSFKRVASLNNDPHFIAALADIVRKAQKQRAPAHSGAPKVL